MSDSKYSIQDPHIKREVQRLKQNVGPGENELAENSFDRYKKDLSWFDQQIQGDTIPINKAIEATKPDLDLVLGELSNEYNGPTGANRWRQIVRFYDSMISGGVLDDNPCDGLKLKRHGISDRSQKSRYIDDESNATVYAPSKEDIELMVENVNTKQDRTRDQLLILLMYHTGCRCNEIRQIKIEDIDREKAEIRLPGKVTKTGKARTVRYGPSAKDRLKKWLDHGLRGRRIHSDSPYLFITQKSDMMSKSMVNHIVRRAAKNAGINEVLYVDAAGKKRWKITSHSLRHACATYMIKNDADIYKVSKYLGHSSVKVTEKIYVHDDGELGVKEAHELGPH
jgi:integrase/recombinase XerD